MAMILLWITTIALYILYWFLRKHFTVHPVDILYVLQNARLLRLIKIIFWKSEFDWS